jgi:hypothetical protein
MRDCTNRNMQCSNNGAGNQTELSNESNMQWNSNLISDLTLPKFTDGSIPYRIRFLFCVETSAGDTEIANL